MDVNNICDSVDSLRKLVLVNNCFTVKMQQTVMAELCCLSRMSIPMDGFVRISQPVLPGEDFEVFDNELGVSPYVNGTQVRGVILCFSYPSLDADGDELEDADKSATLLFYDMLGSLSLPVYKSFMLLGNTVTSDTAAVPNKLVVRNSGNFTLGVEGLLVVSNTEGTTLQQGSSICC